MTACIALFASPLAAQDLGEPVADSGEVETVFSQAEEEGGLTGATTDDADWQDLGIAIPAFATDADRPTPANANGTAALSQGAI